MKPKTILITKMKRISGTLFMIGIMFSFLLMKSCANDDNDIIDSEPTNTIYDVIDGNFAYSEFVEAVDFIGLESQLRDMATDYTVLIPTNDAFAEFYLDHPFESDEEKIEVLNEILRQHIIPNQIVSYDDVEEGISTANMNEDDIYFYLEDIFMIIELNGSYATYAVDTDISTDNGVIHVVEDVITQ